MPASTRAARVAVISDVHGNAVALEAVLAEVDREAPELVVFGGDLTWGPLPRETLELVAGLETPAAFVRGNAERGLLDPADEPTERRTWMREQHREKDMAFLATFAEQLVVEIDGLGPTRFCHGSPRSDEEKLTRATTEERLGPIPFRVAETPLPPSCSLD